MSGGSDQDVTGGPVPDAAAPMRLRAERPRVTRLSRKVLAGLGLAASLGIGGALIFALQTRDRGQGGEELYSTDNRMTADGLSVLPRDYAGPILGPALPGDLGRPILSAQERGQPVTVPEVATPAADPEEQRRIVEAEAARTSKVFFQTNAGLSGADGAAGLSGIGSGANGNAGDGAATGTAISAQDKQSAFLNAATDRRTVSTDRLQTPASPYVLQAGAVIPAALITGIRSDLPGQIIAQVTEPVYDSPTGRILLIPQGTRIIGQYDNNVGFGQRRVLLVWNRLIFPNGRSLVLERLPGADASGYAGLEDGVDYHWGELAKAAGLSTLLAFTAELVTDDDDRLVEALQDGALDTLNDAGQEIIRRQLQVAPTLTIRPGFPLRIVVRWDLIIDPWRN